MHIDIRVAGEPPWDPEERERLVRETADRLEAAGATRVREEHHGAELGHVVMLGPEGQRVLRGLTRHGRRLGSGAVTRSEPPVFDVRAARAGDEAGIARVCREGFAVSSGGLLGSAVIEHQAEHYYDVERLRRELAPRPNDPSWQGYVVAVSPEDEVLGAAGGGTDGHVGHVLVLYLDPPLRGHGIGTALLEHLTDQQRVIGATEQWVSVTEGNVLGIPFYRARGFVVRDRVPYVTTRGEPVGASLRMSRSIPPVDPARRMPAT